jgi:hypothetical protein
MQSFHIFFDMPQCAPLIHCFPDTRSGCTASVGREASHPVPIYRPLPPASCRDRRCPGCRGPWPSGASAGARACSTAPAPARAPALLPPSGAMLGRPRKGGRPPAVRLDRRGSNRFRGRSETKLLAEAFGVLGCQTALQLTTDVILARAFSLFKKWIMDASH